MNRGRNFTIAPVAIPLRVIGKGVERSALGLRYLFRKRMKPDALRLPFGDNIEIIKAHCSHHLVAIDGTQKLAGPESALSAC